MHVAWRSSPDPYPEVSLPRRSPTVTIIGAGFGGIGMAVRLIRAGIGDVTILERADRVGGVWAANSYPGAACDIPASLYSFSFAPKSDWTRRTRRSRRSGTTSRTSRSGSVYCRGSASASR
jgi:cation diffusion facilitator CzcD-associated flavoprotein CzcO